MLRLDRGESPLPPAPKVCRCAAAAIRSAHRYPERGYAALREMLALHHRVGPDMIHVGNGIDELLLLTVLAFVAPGHRAGLTTASTFPGYALSMRACGARCVEVPLLDYRVPLPLLASSVSSDIGAVYVCNPHNPTGTALDATDLERFVGALRSSEAVCVLDEAYAGFGATTPGIDLARRGERVVACRTFSKLHALAGLRVGYAVAPAPLISSLEAVRRAIPYSVNCVAVEAARCALTCTASAERVQEVVARGRTFLAGRLRLLGLHSPPSWTNFLLVDLNRDSGPVVRDLLLTHRVAVQDMSSWGFPGHVRVTIGRQAEMRRFYEALRELLRE